MKIKDFLRMLLENHYRQASHIEYIFYWSLKHPRGSASTFFKDIAERNEGVTISFTFDEYAKLIKFVNSVNPELRVYYPCADDYVRSYRYTFYMEHEFLLSMFRHALHWKDDRERQTFIYETFGCGPLWRKSNAIAEVLAESFKG